MSTQRQDMSRFSTMLRKTDMKAEVEILKNKLIAEKKKRKQLAAEFKKQITVLAALHETTLGLMNHLNIDDLLEAILRRAAELMNTEHGYMYLLDETEYTMSMRIGLGMYTNSRITHIEKGKAFGGEVWRKGKPLTLDDYAAWSGRVQGKEWDCLHAAIGAPLKTHGKVAGVIGFGSTDTKRRFKHDEVLLLGRFAEIASVALENARLFNALENELKERRRTEAQLHLSTERLNAIFKNAKDYIYIKNENLLYEDINPAMKNALGIRNSDIISKSSYDIFELPLAQRLEESDKAVMSGEIVEEEFETVLKGKPAVIHNIKVPLKNLDEKVIGIFGIARDITDRKIADMKINAAKEAVARAEKMASLGAMAAGISHEINQPLNSIKVTSSGIIYLREKGIDQEIEAIIEDVRNISRQADHIDDIIKNLRSFIHAKNESKATKLQLCDMTEAIDLALKLMGNQLLSKGIVLNQCFEPELPRVYANKTGLVEVIVNLLINAMETLDEIENIEKVITIILYTRNGYLYMEVADNGPGIPPDIVSRIFEPFFTSKKKGESMGLGLSIIRSIVESYGGNIKVVDSSASGGTFQVQLPAAEKKNEG